MALLSPNELFSPDFITFLLHRHPDLRQPVSSWLEKAGRGIPKQQRLELFLLACGPPQVLKEAQEDFIRLGKPSRKKTNSSGSAARNVAGPSAMSQGGSNAYNQHYTQQQQQQQSQVQAAQHAALMASMRNQQAQQAGAMGWNVQQQQPGRTTSPAPGQAISAAALQAALLAQQNQQQQAQIQQTAQFQQLLMQSRPNAAHLAQLTALQAAATAAGRGRAGSGPTSAPGSMAAVGSAGNLSALGISPAAAAAQPRPGSAGLPSAGRPAGGGLPGSSMFGASRSGPLGSSPGAADSDAATRTKVQAAIKQMKPNEAPKVEPPDGHDWVQCMGKDGKPGWFAVVRAKAQAMRSTAKRKAEEAAAGQPAGKQGGKKKAADDELVAGGGPVNMMLMDDDAVEAEEAAAKGAVVVEAGNVQEEYLLHQTNTLRLVGRLSKEGGVRAVADSVYPYLSLAAEAFLGQLLNSMVKMRLQREDMGRGYYGCEQGDTSLRAELYKMREREKREAEKRAEIERDELAKLGASRKKLGEEERKAAQAARQQRDIEQKRANVGSTLSMLGIGMRGFGSMSKPLSKTGASKPGMTKTELSEMKKAAEGAPSSSSTPAPSASAASAAGGTPPGAQDAAAAVKQEPGAAAGGGAMPAPDGLQPNQPPGPAASSSAAASAGAGPAPLKAMTLQHQLLSAADVAGQAAAPFVAGGVPPRKVRDGEEPLRELMLADLVAVLERHPLYCRSPELYTLHTLAAMQADSMK